MNQMLSLSALTGAMLFTLPASANSNGGSGVLNFSGNIVGVPCNLSTEQSNQTVDFGQTSKLIGAWWQSFSITLTDCSATPVQMSWSGTHDIDPRNLQTSTANLFIQMWLNGDAAHEFHFDDRIKSLPDFTEGTNIINITAGTASDNWPAVAEGSYTTTANFTLHYD